jgi:hypothetical protein
MPKARMFFMIVTGIGLALLLWVIAVGLSDRPKGQGDVPTNESIATSVAEEDALSPAVIENVSQDGNSYTVSGLGRAGAGITLYMDETLLGQVKTDSEGKWLSQFNWDNADTAHVEVSMTTPDGQRVRSSQMLYILDANTARPEGDPEIIKFTRKLILLSTPGMQTRVLQTPFEALPSRNGFVLEAVDYDSSGGVIFSGSSNKPGKVRIYANTNHVGDSGVDGAGRWRLIFANTMPLGTYNISAERMGDNDPEPLRLTFSFSRMKPVSEAENRPAIIVQRYEDRLQVARMLIGGGYQYTIVYSPEALLQE